MAGLIRDDYFLDFFTTGSENIVGRNDFALDSDNFSGLKFVYGRN